MIPLAYLLYGVGVLVALWLVAPRIPPESLRQVVLLGIASALWPIVLVAFGLVIGFMLSCVWFDKIMRIAERAARRKERR